MLPDGAAVGGEVSTDGAVVTNFYGRPVAGELVVGPWSDALSGWSGMPIRRRAAAGCRRGDRPGSGGGVSLVSSAALEALAAAAGGGPVDGRRFRMLFGVAGIPAHAEVGWLGRRVRIGSAVVRLQGNVGRCAVTTQNPDTGVPDLDTLRALGDYRGEVRDHRAAAVRRLAATWSSRAACASAIRSSPSDVEAHVQHVAVLDDVGLPLEPLQAAPRGLGVRARARRGRPSGSPRSG